MCRFIHSCLHHPIKAILIWEQLIFFVWRLRILHVVLYLRGYVVTSLNLNWSWKQPVGGRACRILKFSILIVDFYCISCSRVTLFRKAPSSNVFRNTYLVSMLSFSLSTLSVRYSFFFNVGSLFFSFVVFIVPLLRHIVAQDIPIPICVPSSTWWAMASGSYLYLMEFQDKKWICIRVERLNPSS